MKRKYVNEDNLKQNIQIVLNYFEDMMRDDIFDPYASNAFGELGFEVETTRRTRSYDGKIAGGSITLKWEYRED